MTRFIAFLLLSVFSFSAFSAEFPLQLRCYSGSWSVVVPSNSQCPQPSCADLSASDTGPIGLLNGVPFYGTNPGFCFNGSSWITKSVSGQDYCPPGTTAVVNSMCIVPDCPSGQSRNPSTGICEQPQQSCPAAGTSAMGTAAAWRIPGSSSACFGSMNFAGCAMTCSAGVSANGFASCTGCTYTGQPASGSELTASPVPSSQKDNPTTPEGCLASGKGYVTNSNGSTTCLPAADSPVPVEKSQNKNAEKTTTNNGQTTKKDTQTTDKETSGGGGGGGSSVERTTKTKTTNPDGTTTETTTTETADKSSFCESNPDAAICTGDDPCKDTPDLASCKELGDPGTEGAVQSSPVQSSMSVVPFTGNSSCPSDIPLPKGAVFSWRYPCDLATGIRPVLLSLAWLAAGLILVGSFKGT